MSGSNTPELRAFKAYYGRLLDVLQNSPERLAVELYSDDMIDREVNSEVSLVTGISTLQKTIKLLDAVDGKIRACAANFHQFLKTLRKSPSLNSIANDIEEMYSKCT